MTISIKFGPINPHAYEQIAATRPLPLQQFWAYGHALQAFGATVYQNTILKEKDPVGHALMTQRRFLGLLRYTVSFRGPLWYTEAVPDVMISATFRAMARWHSKMKWDFLAQQPELENTDHNRHLMTGAGLRRVMSGFSTAWLDLRGDADTLRRNLNGKWRNQLKKAEAEPVTISFGGKRPHQYDWLLDKERLQRDGRRYQATPLGLVSAYTAAHARFRPKSPPPVLATTALLGREKIAGALFLLHGNSATYHIGWAGVKARDLNLHNRVLFESFLELKQRGVRFLDLGGLNTADLAGIARFKLGTGARPINLIGTYL